MPLAKERPEKVSNIKKKANHGLLSISQRLTGIVSLGLPPEILIQHLEQFHSEVQSVVRLINELE